MAVGVAEEDAACERHLPADGPQHEMLDEVKTTTRIAPRFRLLRRIAMGKLDSFFTFQYLIRVRKPAQA